MMVIFDQYKLRSMKPTISQFQKEIQNKLTKRLNPIFGDDIALQQIYTIFLGGPVIFCPPQV